MNDYSIKDLDLAGVRWEIADVPLALRAKWNQESKNTSEPAVNTDNDTTRVMVVPPIAPVATVSVESHSVPSTSKIMPSQCMKNPF